MQTQRKNKKNPSFLPITPAPIRKNVLILFLLLIVMLGFIVYSNALGGAFIWDDEGLVKNNTTLRSFSSFPAIFTRPIGDQELRENYSYRPLQMFSYMVDYSLWKLNPLGYHLTNVILHILAAVCLLFLVNLIFGDWLLSLWSALLFTLHPIQTEAVTYISGRADSLALVCMILCLYFYIKQLQTGRMMLLFLMCISYVFALLSRESSLILPASALIYHYTFKKKIKWQPFSGLLVITFLYIFLRFSYFQAFLPHQDCPTTILQRLPGFLVAVTNYLRLLIVPFGLHMEYGNRLFSFAYPKAIIGGLIVVASVIYALRKRGRNPLVFFAISWFFITLLPQANLYPVNAYMAEHWLYIPSIGFFLLVAYLLRTLYNTDNLKKVAIVSIILLLTMYSLLTIKQNSYWRDPIGFYERTLEYAPQSDRVYSNLANLYRDRGQDAQAIMLYRKAIEIDPTIPQTYYNLGNVYRESGKNEQAIPLYEKAIELNPEYVKAYNNLALSLDSVGNSRRAIEMYKKAIALKPDYAIAHNNLAVTYYHQGEYSLAIEHCNKALALGYPVHPGFLKALRAQTQ